MSAGKRSFPPLLASAISLALAARECLASGAARDISAHGAPPTALEVYIVAFGDENWLDAFECAKAAVLHHLVPKGGLPIGKDVW